MGGPWPFVCVRWSYELNQFSDMRSSAVDQAIGLVTQLVFSRRGQLGGTDAAIRKIARDCRLSPWQVKRFFQPSRRPKDVTVGVWHTLWRGYAAYLESELAKMEEQLHRAQAVGNADLSQCADLAAEVEALKSRLRETLQ